MAQFRRKKSQRFRIQEMSFVAIGYLDLIIYFGSQKAEIIVGPRNEVVRFGACSEHCEIRF